MFSICKITLLVSTALISFLVSSQATTAKWPISKECIVTFNLSTELESRFSSSLSKWSKFYKSCGLSNTTSAVDTELQKPDVQRVIKEENLQGPIDAVYNLVN